MDAVGPLSPVIPWMTAGLLVCSLVLLLHKPLGMLFRLLLRSCAGLAALALLQNTGGLLGISLGSIPSTRWFWVPLVSRALACC